MIRIAMCEIDGCARRALAKGLCSLHYMRLKQSGRTHIVRAPPSRPTLVFCFKCKRPLIRTRGGKGRRWSVCNNCGCKGHPGARPQFTPAQVEQIRTQYAAGSLPRELAAIYGCSSRKIGGIVAGRDYPNVPGALCRIRQYSMPGEKHPRARLRTDDVLLIRARAESGIQQKRIAAEFGLSKSYVSKIVLKKTWREL